MQRVAFTAAICLHFGVSFGYSKQQAGPQQLLLTDFTAVGDRQNVTQQYTHKCCFIFRFQVLKGVGNFLSFSVWKWRILVQQQNV